MVLLCEQLGVRCGITSMLVGTARWLSSASHKVAVHADKQRVVGLVVALLALLVLVLLLVLLLMMMMMLMCLRLVAGCEKVAALRRAESCDPRTA